MLILEPTAPIRQSLDFKKPLLYTGALLGVGILIIPAIVSFSYLNQPTGTYLDPRPQTEMAQATPTPTTTSPQQMILSAQAFLEKAIALSLNPDQTPEEKQQIVALLNQSLDYSNQAVVIAPNAPQSYLIRARVLASSSSIREDALQLAQKDLEIAQKLSGGQTVELPTQVNLINLSPTQQASLAQDLIIAAPNEGTQSSDTSQTDSNVVKNMVTLKAGQSQTIISDNRITAESYLYIVNLTDSTPVFVQSKDTGTATIATTSPASSSLELEYWLVNP